jgi:DNA-binding MarR family transcriptional regulator
VDFEQADMLNAAIRAIGIRHRALAGALLAPLGLHPGQEVLLLELDVHGPRTQGQLAIASGCEPPTITGSARKLEAAGLVVRRPSPTDGRVTIVELSAQGQALIPALRIAWQQLAERTVAGLTSTPVDQLGDTLTDLAHSLTATSDPLQLSQ